MASRASPGLAKEKARRKFGEWLKKWVPEITDWTVRRYLAVARLRGGGRRAALARSTGPSRNPTRRRRPSSGIPRRPAKRANRTPSAPPSSAAPPPPGSWATIRRASEQRRRTSRPKRLSAEGEPEGERLFVVAHADGADDGLADESPRTGCAQDRKRAEGTRPSFPAVDGGSVLGGGLFPPGPGDASLRTEDVVAIGVRRGAHGVAGRVDRLRAIGNAVVPLAAANAWRVLSAAVLNRTHCPETLSAAA